MIEETGSVTELKTEQVAVVRCERGSACGQCAAAGTCHLGEDGKTLLVEAHNPLGAQVGDRVKLSVTTRNFLRSSFFLYGIPVIALVIGAGAGQLIGQNLENGPEPDLVAALMGCLFLVGSFLGIRFCSRSLPKEAFMPCITEIVAHATPNAEVEHGN